jgi:catechol 2,3-dioxygenase-like lactoylglutathione lyase family enzyme
MPFTAIDHPSIACLDLEGLSRWYCDAFGMQVVARNDVGRRGMLLGFDRTTAGGTMIELTAAVESGPAASTFGRAQPGLRHVALRVSDFDRAYGRLKQLAVEFTTDPHQAMGGGRTVLFRDPEGNELQIVERIQNSVE